jgi:transposase
MNIKLTEVISQIHGASGIRIIEAIIAGERDTQHLLLLCDERIRGKKAEKVLEALEGNYNDTWIFLLEQNLLLWQKHQYQLSVIDARIEVLLLSLVQDKEAIKQSELSKAKPIRHHKPSITNLHEIMVRLFGVDASSLSGVNDYTLLRLIGETGVDMSRFAAVANFTSWCGLSAGHHQSGKRSKWIKRAPCNKAGQIFLQVAQCLENSKRTAIGAFIRRLKARRGPKVAYKAGARKIAEAFYNLLTKGKEYVEQGAINYQHKMKEREMALVKKLAKKHKLQLVEV